MYMTKQTFVIGRYNKKAIINSMLAIGERFKNFLSNWYVDKSYYLP